MRFHQSRTDKVAGSYRSAIGVPCPTCGVWPGVTCRAPFDDVQPEASSSEARARFLLANPVERARIFGRHVSVDTAVIAVLIDILGEQVAQSRAVPPLDGCPELSESLTHEHRAAPGEG